MTYINTVQGRIHVNDLGVTLIHEHLRNGFAGWECDPFSLTYDRTEAANICVSALEEAKSYGLNTMVDVTPIDLGRDVELQKIVSDRAGINIISSTGLYEESMGASAYFKFRSTMFDISTEIYEIFMKEITQGINDTGVKANIIKVGTGNGCITTYEESVLKAAAKAHRDTGIPIITHTDGGTMGPEQADLFVSEGCSPACIVIGHIGGNTDTSYHTAVLEKGVSIAFDRFGLGALVPDSTCIECITKLLDLGFKYKIMISHDYVPYFMGRNSSLPEFAKDFIPDWSFSHVFKNIIPSLKSAGLTDDIIDTIMVDNPRRLFGFE